MIAVTRLPADLSLSGNSMILEAKALDASGNVFVWKGARSSITTDGPRGLTDGQFVSVNFEEPNGISLSVNFTAVNTPTLSTHLPAYTNATDYPTYSYYWQKVAAALQANETLRPLFRAYAEANADGTFSLWIEAKAYEPGWSVSFNDLGTGFTTATFPDLYTNAIPDYRLKLDVYAEETFGTDSFRLLSTLAVPPASDGKARFDISQVLASLLQEYNEERIPRWGTASPYLVDNLRNYYLRLYENAPSIAPGSADFFFTATKKAMAGGVPRNLAIKSDWIGARSPANNWLTWRPDGQVVGPNQPFYLGLYQPFNIVASLLEEIFLEVEVTHLDGTTDAPYNALPAQDLIPAAGSTVIFPCGPAALEVPDTAAKYRIRAKRNLPDNTTSDYSTWRTFYVDRTYHEEERYLMYFNAFGCPEVVRCLGDRDADLRAEVEESQAQLYLQSDYYPRSIQHRTDWNDLFTYRTGYMARTELDVVLHELRSSQQVAEILPGGYIPLTLQGKSFPITSTRQNLHAAALEAVPGDIQAYYAPDIVWPYQSLLTGTLRIIGVKTNPDGAIADGATDEQFIAVTDYEGLPAGTVVKVGGGDFLDDADALAAGLADGSAYALKADNPYSLPEGTVRIIGGGDFLSDTQAVLGGTRLLEAYAVEASNAYDLPAGTVKVVLIGDYPSDEAAGAAGVLVGQVYALTADNVYGVAHGLLKLRGDGSYVDDDAAGVAGISAGQVYAIAGPNPYGLPLGTLKWRALGEYQDDIQAAAADVAIGSSYALSEINIYGAAGTGALKKRIT